ncbi:unnamed protein product [Trichogramma brassicae]|uniref:Reverse transcriptase domain-containing protein n=1 Tax=Trichogramma brassicae TaxID=86971 RepID=A0A6H5IQZ4_9HYME|nr:unnamed protein product [Trichogramma brassicae]
MRTVTTPDLSNVKPRPNLQVSVAQPQVLYTSAPQDTTLISSSSLAQQGPEQQSHTFCGFRPAVQAGMAQLSTQQGAGQQLYAFQQASQTGVTHTSMLQGYLQQPPTFQQAAYTGVRQMSTRQDLQQPPTFQQAAFTGVRQTSTLQDLQQPPTFQQAAYTGVRQMSTCQDLQQPPTFQQAAHADVRQSSITHGDLQQNMAQQPYTLQSTEQQTMTNPSARQDSGRDALVNHPMAQLPAHQQLLLTGDNSAQQPQQTFAQSTSAKHFAGHNLVSLNKRIDDLETLIRNFFSHSADEEIRRGDSTKAVEKADRMHDPLHVAAFTSNSKSTPIQSSLEVAAISQQRKSRSNRSSSPVERPLRARSQSKPRFGPNKNLCYYHFHFLNDARRCSTPPCAWETLDPATPSITSINTTNLAVSGQLVFAPVTGISALDKSHPMAHLLARFPQIFSPSAPVGARAAGVFHTLQTTGDPIAQRARRLTPEKLRSVRQQFTIWLEEGTCRPSDSPSASPIHIVPKKSPGQFRVCGDYRKLNAVTTPSKYPVPNMRDFTNILSGKSIFSTLDLLQAFNQIPMAPEDQYPQSNGVLERWHRDFKAALMCQANSDEWTRALPFVMLGLRTRIRSDIDCSAAEMVFGSTLRLPGEFISSEDEERDRRVFTSEFRPFMQAIRPIFDTDHDTTKPFVHLKLASCSHVFVLAQPIKKALDPPYLGPYKVDNRPSEAFYNVLIPNKLGREESKTITTLRLKPAFSSYFHH